MPVLDVSFILDDPDFCDNSLVCIRNRQSVGDNGLAVETHERLPFSGVVTQDSGDKLNRGDAAAYQSGTIFIATRFMLTAGVRGASADIVHWGGSAYTVVNVKDYSSYGDGHIEAVCEQLPLDGRSC